MGWKLDRSYSFGPEVKERKFPYWLLFLAPLALIPLFKKPQSQSSQSSGCLSC